MKTNTHYRIGAFLFAMLSTSFLFQRCENDSCPDDENAVVESFQFLNVDTQYAWVQGVDPNKPTVNLVIKSQQDYDKYIGTSSDIKRPSIDFSQFVLLAGRTITPECAFVGSQIVLDRCGTYTFEVTLEPKDCHAFTTSNYFVIIHKTEHPIDFHIKK